MKNTPDPIAARIIKLFNMATHANSNPFEAELAMTKMRQMMAEHDLSLADVEAAAGRTAEKPRIEIVKVTSYTRKGLLARYDHAIANAVATLTSTSGWLQTRYQGPHKWQSMQFIGTPADAELAAQLFHVFIGAARHYARLAYGGTWKVNHSSFVYGFGNRLNERAKDWMSVVKPGKRAQYGMILVGKSAAIEQYKDALLAPFKDQKTKKVRDVNINPEAYFKGVDRANNTDLLKSAKIGGR